MKTRGKIFKVPEKILSAGLLEHFSATKISEFSWLCSRNSLFKLMEQWTAVSWISEKSNPGMYCCFWKDETFAFQKFIIWILGITKKNGFLKNRGILSGIDHIHDFIYSAYLRKDGEDSKGFFC